MGTPRIKDRIDKVHDESNSRYELASMVVELQEEVAALTAQRDKAAAYIVEASSDQIGSGDDPVGFLIASHRHIADRLRAAEAQRDELQKRIGYTAVPQDSRCESPADVDDIGDEPPEDWWPSSEVTESADGVFSAGIHDGSLWGNRIECHGPTEDYAIYLRDLVLGLLMDTGTVTATTLPTNGTEGLRAELDAAKRALAEMHVEPAAWQLVDVRGGKCGWVEIYSFDPSDGGYDRKREAADRMNPHDAPHRWQPLFAALAAKSTAQKGS